MTCTLRSCTAMAFMLAVGCSGDDTETTSNGSGTDSGTDTTDSSSTMSSTTSSSASTTTSTTSSTTDATTTSTSTSDATETSATTGAMDTTDTTGAADCGDLGEDACTADPDCAPLTGQPIVPEGDGFCLGEPGFLFCTSATEPCLPATQTVCMDDSAYEAWSQCALPDGWTPCQPPGQVNGDC